MNSKESNSEDSVKEFIIRRRRPVKKLVISDEDNETTSKNSSQMYELPYKIPSYSDYETVDSCTPSSKASESEHWLTDSDSTNTDDSIVLSELLSTTKDKSNSSNNVKEVNNISNTELPSPSKKCKSAVLPSRNSSTNSQELCKSFIAVHSAILNTKTKNNNFLNIDKNVTSIATPEFISTDFTGDISKKTPVIKDSSVNVDSSRPITILQNIIVSPPKNRAALEENRSSGSGASTSNSSTHRLHAKSSQKVKAIGKDENKKAKKNLFKANLSTSNNTDNDEWRPLAFRLMLKIIKYIIAHNNLKTLLTETDTTMLKSFLQLSKEEYMYFCIKLYTRIQKWYNIIKLSNIINLGLPSTEIIEMYNSLTDHGFVESDYLSESCEYLLDHLLVHDIKDICTSFKLKSGTKHEMIHTLLINCKRQTTLTYQKSTEYILKELIKEKMGFCVKLKPSFFNLLKKVHLLYSFTLVDFKTTNDLYLYLSSIENKSIFLPEFQIDIDAQIFSSIEHFSSFAEAWECQDEIFKAHEKKDFAYIYTLCKLSYLKLNEILQSDVDVTTKPSYLMRFTAGYKYTKALSNGLKFLTKQFPEEVEQWLTFLLGQPFCQHLHGQWYNTLIMVQNKHLKQHKNAISTLLKALNVEHISEFERINLNVRAETFKRSSKNKLSKLLHDRICFIQPHIVENFSSIEINAQAIRSNRLGKKRNYLEKEENCQHIFSVEDIALKHYYANGFTNGLHCEGTLLATIFFILFWDIIYDDKVPGVFISEIQYIPLDLFSKEFYSNRKQAIDRRLDEILSKWPLGQLKSFICDIWEKHAHKKSYINDTCVNEATDLYDIILCIGRVKLSDILGRLVKNFRLYKAGIPDLFLWNVTQKKCKFVEVKGENDKLSSKQILWLNFLHSVGASVEVCHVHTIGSKSSIKNKKVKTDPKKDKA